MKVLIVESPRKVAKIQSHLDSVFPGQWRVVATVGHWRGLPRMDGQSFTDVVDLKTWHEEFAIHRHDVAKRLASALGGAKEVYLGTDPDREGEAIAWHIAEQFNLRDAKRVRFNEVTKSALVFAVQNATDIDRQLVDAQRARALLDYLIGLEVSRLLWRFGAKSAGRVQSCALRVLVQREHEIETFKPSKYWTVHADYAKGFRAMVAEIKAADQDGEEGRAPEPGEHRLAPVRFASEADALRCVEDVKGVPHLVEGLRTKEIVRRPPPPFTTSTFLATASDLGISTNDATAAAQRLFEAGLVTYIRTDSVALSEESVANIRTYLGAHHPELIPPEPLVYQDKASAQGAHEAIRPTAMENPDAGELTGLDRRVYDLIWRRTLVCQMTPARLLRTEVAIRPGETRWRFRATGTVIKEPGFTAFTGQNTPKKGTSSSQLPRMEHGERLAVRTIAAHSAITKPPVRYRVASLIGYLERHGVGRPSTLNGLFSTLFDRGYVQEEKRLLVPTELGRTADHLVRVGFDDLSRVPFTAETETSLDAIATGKLERPIFLADFHRRFLQLMTNAVPAFDQWAKANPEYDRQAEVKHTDPCPKCQSFMIIRRGRFGRYAGCSSKECGHTLNLTPLKECQEPCPKCGGMAVEQPYVKDGRRKVFYRCTNDGCDWKSHFRPPKRSRHLCHVDPKHGAMLLYKTSKGSLFICGQCGHKSWTGPKPPDCPDCGSSMRERKSAHGKFWGCPQYPQCRGTRNFDGPKKKTERKNGSPGLARRFQ